MKSIPVKIKMLKPLDSETRELLIWDVAYSKVKKNQRYCDVCSRYDCHCAEAKAYEAANEYSKELQGISDEKLIKLADKTGDLPYYLIGDYFEYWDSLENPLYNFVLDFSKYIQKNEKIELYCSIPFDIVDSALNEIYTKFKNEKKEQFAKEDRSYILSEFHSSLIDYNPKVFDQEDEIWTLKE